MYSASHIYSKYRNRKTNGFDSRKEFNRWAELSLMQRAGKISDLKRQVKYDLIPTQYFNGKCLYKKVSYVADFTYTENGQTVVEDVKGYKTAEYIIKKKLMFYVHGIIVRET